MSIRNFAYNRISIYPPTQVTSTFNANSDTTYNIISSSSGTLPYSGLSWFASPSDNPTLQAGMDNFNPSTTTGTPNPSAPIISRITSKASPGECVWVTGHQFDDQTSLVVYSEVNGTTSLTTAQTLTRLGNKMLCRISTSAIPNSFMLGWLSHPTYGYSDPYPINDPGAFTLHSSFYGTTDITGVGTVVARAGDEIRIGGINLSSKQATEKCWAYIKPTSGTGTWLNSNTVCDGMSTFSLPATTTNATYNVWVHSGRGGQWGWKQCNITLTVKSAQSLVSDKLVGPPNGVDDTTSIQAAATSIGTNNTGYIVFEAGTYTLGTSIVGLTGGFGRVHFKGAGKNSTTLALTPTYSSGIIANVANGFFWAEDMTFNFTGGSSSPDLGGFSRIKNVRVITKTLGIFGQGMAVVYSAIDSDFKGGSAAGGVVNPVGWMKNCTITKMFGTEGAVFSVFGQNNVGLDNVHVYEGDPSNSGGGRFYIRGYDTWGTSMNGCASHNMNVSGDQNRGEQVLLGDGGYTEQSFYASSGDTAYYSTITYDADVMSNGFNIKQTLSASSSNATSTAPVLVFSNGNNFLFTSIQILGGPNTIPGTYAITSKSFSNMTLTGGPIGTVNSLSTVTANGIYYPWRSVSYNLSSTNANSSTPTLTGGSYGGSNGDVNRFLYIKSGNNFIPTLAKILSSSASQIVLDRAVGSSATASSGTAYLYNTFTSRNIIKVVGGKGVGQFGKVQATSSIVGNNLVFTVDRQWRVPVDNTSYIRSGYGPLDTSIYNCQFEGDGGQVTSGSGASNAFECFGPNAHNYFYGTNARSSNFRYGLTEFFGGNWNYISDVTITNCTYGVRIDGATYAEDIEDINLSLSTYNKGNISNCNVGHLWLRGLSPTDNLAFNEWNSTGTSSTAMVVVQGTGGNVHFNNSSISLGAGTFTGSRIITSGSSVSYYQYNPSSGQFKNFQS